MNDHSRQLILYIGRLALLCGFSIFLFSLITSTAIQGNIRNKRLHSLSTLLPSATTFSIYSKNKHIENASMVIGHNSQKKKVGYVFQTEGMGYGGPISLLVGISGSKVTGIEILSHAETPGIGAFITDSKPMTGQTLTFAGQFNNKSIFDQFSTHEDIMALTGATITSQAVADGIQKAIKIYRRLENVQYED